MPTGALRARLVRRPDAAPSGASIGAVSFGAVRVPLSSKERDLAITAKHLYPIELGEQLNRLAREIDAWAGRSMPRLLERGMVLEF